MITRLGSNAVGVRVVVEVGFGVRVYRAVVGVAVVDGDGLDAETVKDCVEGAGTGVWVDNGSGGETTGVG